LGLTIFFNKNKTKNMRILFFTLALFISMLSKIYAQPCSLICKNTEVGFNNNGEAILTPSMIVDAIFCNNDSLQVQVLSIDGNEILPYSQLHTLTCEKLGRIGNFKVRVAEIKNNVIGTFCNAYLTVIDPLQTCTYPSAACAAAPMICNQDITINLDGNNQLLLTPEIGGVNIHPDCKDFMKVILYSWDTLEVLPMKASHLLDCKYTGTFQVQNIVYYDSVRYNYCWYTLTVTDTDGDCPPIENCDLTCKDLVKVSVNANGDATFTPIQFMDGNEYLPCKDDLRISVQDLFNKVILPFSTSQTLQCQTLGAYKVVAQIFHNGIPKNSCWSNLEVNDDNKNCNTNPSSCVLLCQDATIDLDIEGKVKLNWQSFGLQAQCNIDSLKVSVSDENGKDILPLATSHFLDCSYLGKYKVRMAEVLNGNVGTNCVSTITIKDPLKSCKECKFDFCDFELDVNLDENGTGTINWDVALLPQSYTGECENFFRIRVFTHEGNVFPYGRSHAIDCSMVGDYLVGTSILKNGTYSPDCFTTIHIKDPFEKCSVAPGNFPLTIESKFKGPFVNEITLNDIALNKVHYALFEIPQTNVKSGINTLKFKGKKQKLNGVNTLDLVNMIKYLIEETTPTPLEAILSDFDRSGFLGINDITSLRKAIIGLSPNENEFVFLKKGITFPPNFDPFNFGTEVYNSTFEGQNAATENFIINAYLTGDIDLSGNFTSEMSGEGRNSAALAYEDIYMIAGQTYKIQLKSENVDQLQGMQAAINFDGVTILSVNETNNNDLLSHINKNTLNLSYLTLQHTSNFKFSVNILAQKDGRLSDIISLDKSISPMFVSNDLNITTLNLMSDLASSTNELEVEKIYISPNPSNGYSKIILQKVRDNVVNIFSLDGKLVHQFNQTSNTIELAPSMFHGKGVFIIKVINQGGIFTCKVMII
jgi:hypothetical protein